MESHLFFINIPSFYTWYKKVFQGITYSSFDQKLFESSPWMGSNGSIVAFFTGVIGSAIFVCIICDGSERHFMGKAWKPFQHAGQRPCRRYRSAAACDAFLLRNGRCEGR